MSRADVALAALNGYNRRSDARVGLRELREAREITIRQAEKATGISRATLSMIERGVQHPTSSQLQLLSDLYAVDVDGWQLVVEYRINPDLEGGQA